MIFNVVFKIVVFQSAELNSHFVGKILSQKLGWIIEKEVLIKSYFPSLHLLHFFVLLQNWYIVKEKMRHAIRCFSIRYDVFDQQKQIFGKKNLIGSWTSVSFRMIFSERSLVRIDSHEWTLNLPQNMIFQINSETTLALEDDATHEKGGSCGLLTACCFSSRLWKKRH